MTQPRSAIQTVLAYHEATKHSVESIRRDARMLDFTNMPRPWKLYAAPLPETPLPTELTRTGASAGAALGLAGGAAGAEGAEPTLTRLASVLQLSAGITKRLRAGAGHMYFRAAACTGALYHIELYVISGELPGLPAGVHHYGAHDNTLRRLRDGDFRAAAMEAAGLTEPPAAVVAYTSTFWRNAWKYGNRTYRHAFWDCGTVLANTTAAARANGLRAEVVTRFADAAINDLIDVDGATEATVALVALGEGGNAPAASVPARLGLPVAPLSRSPLDYPLIREAHDATTLSEPPPPPPAETPVGHVPSVIPTPSVIPAQAGISPLASLPQGETPEGRRGPSTLEEVVLKRGSTRRFAREPIAFEALATMLDVAARPTKLDAGAAGEELNALYVVAQAVDGLPQGVYRLRRDGGELEPVSERETRGLAEHLALDQPLGGDASASLYFVADLPAALERLGARGYRTAHLDASIRAGRVYLAAYALGLGATGLTFYDDEATEALGAPAESAITFLIAVGRPQPRLARRP